MIYNLFSYILLPFVVLKLYYRSIKAKDYRKRIQERFGFVPCICEKEPIWIHAVSVGEFIAAAPLIKEIQKRSPDKTILITTTTPTGSQRVIDTFGDSISNGLVFHCYAPYDTPGFVKRFLKRTKPSTLIIMETEIWPNIISLTKKSGSRVFLANARLSEKSLSGYSRFQRIVGSALNCFDMIFTRSQTDLNNFIQLGAPQERTVIAGNIKYDLSIPESINAKKAEFLKNIIGIDRKIIVAASTHDGEEKIVLDSYRQILKNSEDNLLLIIVPRHPERFNSVTEEIKQSGLSFARRSTNEKCHHKQVFLADSMGEMLLFFSVAKVAFIGGSFSNTGGHNPLEALAFGVPVISGPDTFNFTDEYNGITIEQCGIVVDNKDMLGQQIEKIINAAKSDNLSEKCLQFIEKNRGAIRKICDEIITE